MRIDGRRSSNVEDRRGMGIPLVAGGGIGSVIIALLYYFLSGGTPATMNQEQRAPTAQVSQEDAKLADFVSVVLADTEDVWHDIFRNELGKEYVDPKLVMYSDYVQSACGLAQSATGPFYCPLDQRVYIDLSFYREMKDRFQAPGDFAQAYVIAHEVGHHVQNLLGISEKVQQAQQASGQTEANALSVRLELQADCFAGVWANHAQKMKQILEPGDIEEALNAASAIGDDRLQKETRGYVSPDSFTHGTSEQRVTWFKRGFESGQMGQCETFKDSRL